MQGGVAAWPPRLEAMVAVTHTSSLCLLLLLQLNRLNSDRASNLADYDESHTYTVATRVCTLSVFESVQ